ncbi:hypothetical protein HK104_003979, partial [Borealophlyctis nickersoniae]
MSDTDSSGYDDHDIEARPVMAADTVPSLPRGAGGTTNSLPSHDIEAANGPSPPHARYSSQPLHNAVRRQSLQSPAQTRRMSNKSALKSSVGGSHGSVRRRSAVSFANVGHHEVDLGDGDPLRSLEDADGDVEAE